MGAWTLNAMLEAMRERGAGKHRMFRVIVLGGLALGATSSAIPACGGVVQTRASGGSGGAADATTDYGFPSEATGGAGGTGGFPMEGAVIPDAFPFEGDGAGGSMDAQPDVGFPFEATGGAGGSIDAAPDVGCFPMETAIAPECGAPQPVQDASSAQDSAQETPAP